MLYRFAYRLSAAFILMACLSWTAACRATGEEDEGVAAPPPVIKPSAGAGGATGRPGGMPGSAGAPAVSAPDDPMVSDPRRIKLNPGRGFYDAPISVTVTADEPGAVIRFTLDGKKPSATEGTVYSGPIAIKETTAVRVAAFSKNGALVSYNEAATYIFVNDVIRQSNKPPAGWPTMWGPNVVDYGMDARVVDDPRYAGTIKNDLKGIPSLALIMDLPDLFDAKTGIYANADQHGDPWERPGSLELIFPDGKPGFQINSGVRIRGGFSRSKDNPKHAFRVYFRKTYGSGKLKYPLFKGPVKEYDNFDIRCAQNYSWSFQGDSRGIFVRDQLTRDAQGAMGQGNERGDFYHLYINGQYWGLYDTAERTNAKWAAAYFGGAETDYDVVKVAPTMDYSIVATDGDLMSWTRLYNLMKASMGDDALFWKFQGRTVQGVRDMATENLVDMDNLIDYHLLQTWGGNFDAPVSRFLGDMKPNNSYMIRNKTMLSDGFRFVAHDSEHTMNLTDMPGIMIDRLGPFVAGEMDISKSGSQNIFQKLFTSPEFQLRVADRYNKHFFNNGAMTIQNLLARYNGRVKEIDRAVVGESARWGDAKRPMATQKPFTRDDQWLPEVIKVRDQWIMKRNDIFLAQIKAKKLWPTTPPAVLMPNAGDLPRALKVMIEVPAGGMVFYTTDGSDPRMPGGANNPKAVLYGGAGVGLTADGTIKARAKIGNNWSPLTEATYHLK